MTQTMTRNKVQILLMPDIEQTAAQSPDAVNADLEQTEGQQPGYMLQISSRREKLQGQAAEETVPDLLQAREWQESKRLHRGRPTDIEVPSQVSKDGRIQQKDRARQQAQRKEKTDPHSAERLSSATSKEERGDARVQCKTEASRRRRAVASDRNANDIAKQVTINRKRKSSEHVKKSCV